MIHKMMQLRGGVMRPLTLRNLPPAVARAVKERADADGVSLNKAVIRMLEEALGLARRKPARINHDFDDLIGVWTEQEASEMLRYLAEERKVEPEMWK